MSRFAKAWVLLWCFRFTPGSNGRKSSLKREKVFDAYRSSECTEKDNVVLGMRTIGNKLYAVVEEKPVRLCTHSSDIQM